MELNELKRIWDKVNELHPNKTYSTDEIQSFRKERSQDFTQWVRSGLILDIILKLIIATTLMVMVFLFKGQLESVFPGLVMALIIAFSIPFEIEAMKRSRQIDRAQGSVHEVLQSKVTFLKTLFYKIQFVQAITNPMLVIAGGMIYYYVKYGQIPDLDTQDILVNTAIIILSFLLTLPTTLSMYGYHLRTLSDCLESFTDPDEWEYKLTRFKQQKRTLFILLASLLIIGLILLALLVIL